MLPDQQSFRNAFSRFATGIAIVATHLPDGSPVGMTINSLTSVSLDPPLALYCLGLDSRNADAFAKAPSFAFSILAEEQEDLAARFASRDLQDRFAGIPHTFGITGSPLITGALATIDCRRESVIEAGDHLIVIGRAVGVDVGDGAPLAYFRSRFVRLA